MLPFQIYLWWVRSMLFNVCGGDVQLLDFIDLIEIVVLRCMCDGG